MARAPTQAEDDPPAAQRRRELLGAAIEANYGHLCASAAAVIRSGYHRLKDQQVVDLAEEVVHQAIARALGKAEDYDPSRRVVPWLMQFIIYVLKERHRNQRRERKQSDLSELAWEQLLAGLSCQEPSASVTKLLPRLDQALGKISIEQREILLLCYRNGLDGMELAQAVGAATEGAARVRLHRARKALRQEFTASSNDEEVNP